MKFTIERDAIRAAMATIEKITPRGDISRILSCVKIDARGSRVTLTTTDLESWVSTTLEADVDETGSTAIDAADFSRATSAGAAGAQLEIAADAIEAKLRVGKARFRLPALPADEFPVGRDMTEVPAFSLPAADLAFLFGKALHAAAIDDVRHFMNGVHVNVVAGKGHARHMRAAATDGHRAALVEVAASAEAAAAFSALPGGVILPRQAIAHILRLAGNEGDITVKANENLIDFDFGEVRLVSKLIDGPYAEIDKVVPRGHPHIALIERDAFKQLTDNMAPFAAELPSDAKAKFKPRSVRLQFDGARLEMSAGNDNGAQGCDEIAIEGFETPVKLSFHVKYLQSALEHAVGTQVRLEIGEPRSPVLLTCPQDSRLRMIVMPMKV